MATSFGRVIFLCACGLTAGCSNGGGAAVETAQPEELEPGRIASVNAEAGYANFAARAEELARTFDMPFSGTATYSGYLDLTLSPDAGPGFRTLMDATLTADFAAGTLSGDFTDPVLDGGGALAGSGRLRAGQIADADVSGRVEATIERGSSTYVVDAGLTGEFLGSGGEMVVGDVGGQLDGSRGTDGSVTGELLTRR